MVEKRKFKKSKLSILPKKTKVAESDVLELKFGKGKELVVKSIKSFKNKLFSRKVN